MALTSVAGWLHLGNILSTGGKSLAETAASPNVKLGTMSIQVDDFGHTRIFRYERFMSGGNAGTFTTRATLVTGTTDGTGTTTSAIDATNFTAGDEVGKIFQVNVASGAAPEGETALIVSNTASNLYFDKDYPLSVAAASGITYSDWAAQQYIAGATGVSAINGGGILMGTPAAKEYGWAQIHGFHPAAFMDVAGGAVTAGIPGGHGQNAGVLVLALGTPTAAEIVALNTDTIGWFPMATSTTAVQAAFVIDLFNQTSIIGA